MVASLLPLLPLFIILMQQAILCYNLLAGNYVIIAVEDADQNDNVKTLHKVSFEYFIRQEKPYLNPELKITDLAAALATNRSYLSNFINSKYRMNFSRYINQQRLEELERLNNDPAYNSFSKVSLLLKAGFSSYQGYSRFAKKERALHKRPFIN
jgi:YesN/AraC family two-component response regulator